MLRGWLRYSIERLKMFDPHSDIDMAMEEHGRDAPPIRLTDNSTLMESMIDTMLTMGDSCTEIKAMAVYNKELGEWEFFG